MDIKLPILSIEHIHMLEKGTEGGYEIFQENGHWLEFSTPKMDHDKMLKFENHVVVLLEQLIVIFFIVFNRTNTYNNI